MMPGVVESFFSNVSYYWLLERFHFSQVWGILLTLFYYVSLFSDFHFPSKFLQFAGQFGVLHYASV